MQAISKPVLSTELARLVEGEHIGDAVAIDAVGTLERGSKTQIGFLADERYHHLVKATQLGCVLVSAPLEDCPASLIVVSNVREAWLKISLYFEHAQKNSVALGIHPAASVATTAKIGDRVSIAAGAVVADGAEIGDDVHIEAQAYVAAQVKIGAGTRIGPGVRLLSDTIIGERCNILGNAVIGERGFGNVFENGKWLALPQLGGVRIGNDVEIGAGTMVDRGAVDNTVIEDGVKIDNLVMVAHNVVIGAHTAIAGCCVIAGSVTFGKYCVVGGATVFAGHIHICDGAQFTGHSSISKSIATPGVYSSGIPVMPVKQWHRFVAKLRMITRDK